MGMPEDLKPVEARQGYDIQYAVGSGSSLRTNHLIRETDILLYH